MEVKFDLLNKEEAMAAFAAIKAVYAEATGDTEEVKAASDVKISAPAKKEPATEKKEPAEKKTTKAKPEPKQKPATAPEPEDDKEEEETSASSDASEEMEEELSAEEVKNKVRSELAALRTKDAGLFKTTFSTFMKENLKPEQVPAGQKPSFNHLNDEQLLKLLKTLESL